MLEKMMEATELELPIIKNRRFVAWQDKRMIYTSVD
jgi:hypothetical protein